MKKLVISLICILVFNNHATATLPVIDSANLANSARQVAAWGQQLIEMKKQLEQAKQQHMSLTGNRGLGTILYSPELRNFLPPEYQGIYDAVVIEDINNVDGLVGAIFDFQDSIRKRSKNDVMIDKAIGLKGYEATQQRLNQIESLMNEINKTQDLKSIAELQARISIEQAATQNEITRLQLISQLQVAEKKLLQEKKREMSHRLLSSSNTNVPRIR